MEQNQTTGGNSYLLPVSILAAAILIAGALVYNAGLRRGGDFPETDSAETAGAPPTADDDIILGDANAKVLLVEFGDYQCPFCGRFYKETEGKLREEYIETGKMKMVYRDLAFLGEESIKAAEAAQCAADQGKYWPYHDYLFAYLWDNYFALNKNGENVGAFSDDNLKKFAEELTLDTKGFNQCFDSRKYKAEVEKDIADAKVSLGGQLSTPTVFINDRLVRGALPYESFKKIIDEELVK